MNNNDSDMKRLIYTITLLAFSFSAFGQNYSTIDGLDGNWTTISSWTGGAISGTINGNTVKLNEQNSNTEIRGTISHKGDIDLGGNNANLKITSGNTLIIDGNLSIGGGSKLFVESNAILIVTGIMSVEGNSVSNNNGTIVALQELEVKGSTTFTNNSDIYTANPTGNKVGDLSPAPKTIEELENDNLDLWNKIISVLPIKLLSFTGVAQNNAVQLDWITAWEENFDYFTVERAGTDLEFKAIGQVSGTGNTTAEVAYDFTDNHPMQGQAFYRLKATDYDGSIEYHKIISIFFDGYVSSEKSIYPNPVIGNTFKVKSPGNEVQEVRLLDLSGKTVYSTTLPTGLQEVKLPEAIRPGAYLLMVTGNRGAVHQQKIMVI